MQYAIGLHNYQSFNLYIHIGADFEGTAPNGETISFNNYYMEKNHRPFLAVSGEFHFSRMDAQRWEDELSKCAWAASMCIYLSFLESYRRG